MTLTTMYPGKINSPELTLTYLITDVATTIEVTGDISKLPAAPNLFVIGTGEDCETVYYPTDAVSNIFTGVTRGFQGTAIEWAAGSVVARNFTAYDYDTLRTNVLDLETRKGIPTYDAIVYQDATTTYAIDKDGNVLSSVLISSYTDDVPIQAAITYAGTGTVIIHGDFAGTGAITQGSTFVLGIPYYSIGSITGLTVRNLNRALSTPLILLAYSAVQAGTNSAVLNQLDTELTNGFPIPYAIFTDAGAGTEKLCWITEMPTSWDNGQMTAQIECMSKTTATANTEWKLYAVRVPTAATLDATLAQVGGDILVSHVTQYYKYLSSVTSPFTITGTGNTILWMLKRSADAEDTLNGVDAWFLAVKIMYGVT